MAGEALEATTMADENNIEKRPADPFVAARISNPGEPAKPTLQLAGLLGDSDREGYRRLYLNTKLDYYLEFRTADVLATEAVSPDQPPFTGLDATRVTLPHGASVDYVRTRQASSGDDFLIDPAAAARVGGIGGNGGIFQTQVDTILQSINTCGFCDESLWGPCVDTLVSCPATCDTCVTCGVACQTIQTCVSCNGTCATCFTCGEVTCVTCRQNGCGVTRNTCWTCGNRACRTVTACTVIEVATATCAC